MATELFANNTSTTVSSGGTTAPVSGTTETWTVASSASFPAASSGAGTQFHVVDQALPAEKIAVTNVSGTTWTVTRGAESTTPVAHTAGFTIVQVVTAGPLAAFVQNPMTASGDTVYGGAAGAPARLAGDTSNARKFLRGQSAAGVAQAPAWDTLQSGDLATAVPWRFDVTAPAYGAKGDGKAVHDGAVTASGTTLTCATSTPFTSGDVGKLVMVKGAGAANPYTLVTTIASFTDSGHVVLTAAAATTVTAALVMWATDDTAAIQSAINAADAYALLHGGATVFTPPGSGLFYGVGGALVTGGTTHGNAQLTLPVHAPNTIGPKVNLTFAGVGSGAGVQHWQQTSPVLGPSTWVSFGVFASAAAQSTSIGTSGNPCCLGGPAQPAGYGTSALLYSNMYVIMRDMSILTTYSAQGIGYSAFDFSGVACAALQDFAIGTTGVYADNDFASVGTFAGGLAYGGLMPANGNNDLCDVRNLTVHGGYTYGFGATEHTDMHDVRILRNWSGLALLAAYSSGAGALHKFRWSLLSSEGNTNDIQVIGAGAAGHLYVEGSIDNEGGIFIHQDGSSGWATATGLIRCGSAGNSITSPATLVQMLNEQSAPGPAAALTLTINTAIQNTYYQWATVTLAGGTVTSVQVGNTLAGASAPAMTTIYSQASAALPLMTVRVPPGGWIQVNGTVTPATNSWVLG